MKLGVLWALPLGLVVLAGCQKKRTEPVIHSEQLLVVRTDRWDSTTGTLTLIQRGRPSRAVHPPIPVTLGRNGLAWGRGLHDTSLNQPPLKQEGDGKSPAGIFPLESLFSYEDLTADLPSLTVTTNTFCVDDPKSKYYNQIVSGDQVTSDWSSAETMRMPTDHYKYGIVVGYNTPAPGGVTPGAGSCIFIHLGEPDGTTAGCTAMSEGDMKFLIGWLKKSHNPLIVQGPESALQELARKHPSLPILVKYGDISL